MRKITDEHEISQAFNKHYINIVEKSCRQKPNKIGTTLGSLNDSDVVDKIIKSYQNHPTEIASVVLVNKGKPDKYDVLNYRSVSILSASSKIQEKIMKNQLMSYLDKYFSPFISAYWESNSTQQVLIRLLEEWREKLDKNFIVGAGLINLSKAFDRIPHDLIIAKLAECGIERETLRLIYSFLKVGNNV